jgi:hypothetical protein
VGSVNRPGRACTAVLTETRREAFIPGPRVKAIASSSVALTFASSRARLMASGIRSVCLANPGRRSIGTLDVYGLVTDLWADSKGCIPPHLTCRSCCRKTMFERIALALEFLGHPLSASLVRFF